MGILLLLLLLSSWFIAGRLMEHQFVCTRNIKYSYVDTSLRLRFYAALPTVAINTWPHIVTESRKSRVTAL